MKTWNDLTPEQQEKAIQHEINEFLKALCEYGIGLEDSEAQGKLEAAFAEADAMQTPWFVHEYIWEALEPEVTEAATAYAETALYPESGEYVSELRL